MSLRDIIGNFGLVAKVDVSNLNSSIAWYQEKLGLVHDPQFDVPGWWAQLNITEVPQTAVGLNMNPNGVGTGGGATTFVVEDIKSARNALIAKGVAVGEITQVPPGVSLASFKDPDGNNLGLRQNPPSFPKMW
jgi:lactoylglutathione lyase